MEGFSWCRNLKKITLSKGLTTIGFLAFKNCSSLKEITLPSTLEGIGSNAFANTILEKVKVPKNCHLYDYVFGYNDNLKKIILPNFEIESGESGIDKGAFRYCDRISDITFYSRTLPTIHNLEIKKI